MFFEFAIEYLVSGNYFKPVNTLCQSPEIDGFRGGQPMPFSLFDYLARNGGNLPVYIFCPIREMLPPDLQLVACRVGVKPEVGIGSLVCYASYLSASRRALTLYIGYCCLMNRSVVVIFYKHHQLKTCRVKVVGQAPAYCQGLGFACCPTICPGSPGSVVLYQFKPRSFLPRRCQVSPSSTVKSKAIPSAPSSVDDQ